MSTAITMTGADWLSMLVHFMSLSLLAVGGAISQAHPDQEFTKFMVRIQGKEGVVKVKQTKVHEVSCASICLSRGTVTTRCSASANRSSRSSKRIRSPWSRLKWVKR